MSWAALFTAFLICHLAGDFLLQTDFQAVNKVGGLGRDPVARRALWMHVLTYTLAFVPALAWVAGEHTVAAAVGVALLVALPHAGVDDGRFVAAWLRRVKHIEGIVPEIPRLGADQTWHIVALAAVALLTTA